jgi:hypothetical protein
MRSVLAACAAVFVEFNPVRIVSLVLTCRVVSAFALLARQRDDYSGFVRHYSSPTFGTFF